MESSCYLAHISAEERTQTIWEHVSGTALLAGEFARPFGGGDLAELAGLAHDIGKYSQAFQKRLKGAPVHVDHATAGAIECLKRGQLFSPYLHFLTHYAAAAHYRPYQP